MSGVDWALVAAIEDTINHVTDLREMLDKDTPVYSAVDLALRYLDDALLLAKAAKATR